MQKNVEKPDFFDRVQFFTEKFFTRRKQKRRVKKEKQKARHPVLDWIYAILWAACMVLLINQFLFQAFRIPTGSMINSLNIGDHVVVNKLVYGPELLPGVLKIPSPFKPKRNDIIIFENPSYISSGLAFDIAKRVIYMLTLSLVDIDRDEAGEPRVHLLIKRAAGTAGDRFVQENGKMKILFSGETDWVDESDYKSARGWNHNINRLMHPENYPALIASGYASAYMNLRLPIPASLLEAANESIYIDIFDIIALERARLEMLRMLAPGEQRYVPLLAQQRLGRYVPEGRIYPLGDNRENSRDGRSFGPVRLSRVLGKGLSIYWPVTRLGRIR